MRKFKCVIIFGHKKQDGHTHSYIHSAFMHAFKSMGYDTLWLDNNDKLDETDFADSLFLTEGQVDQKMPLRSDCRYILHNCYDPRFKEVEKQTLRLQTFTTDIVERFKRAGQTNIEKLTEYLYFETGTPSMLYLPWATDLLPHEFPPEIDHGERRRTVYWVGTIGKSGEFQNASEIDPFVQACTHAGVGFKPLAAGLPDSAHMTAIRRSYVAPAIVGKWQKEKGYIPCRIFKNISYGQMGVTNSAVVNAALENTLVTNPDPYQLFADAEAARNDIDRIRCLRELVKEKHTYVNRINTILELVP